MHLAGGAAIVQVLLFDLRFLHQRPAPQRTSRIFPPQKFPLRDSVAGELCIVKAASFTGQQIGDGGDAAGRVRRGRVAVINGAVGIQRTLVLLARPGRKRFYVQTALKSFRARVSGHALPMRGRGQRYRTAQKKARRQAKHFRSRKSTPAAGTPGKKEPMAEEKRHASQVADNTPEPLQYRFSPPGRQ